MQTFEMAPVTPADSKALLVAKPRHAMKALVVLFAYLQLMDFLTTLVVLSHGGREMNPIVAELIEMHPLLGLLTAKLFAMALAVFCALSGRDKLLMRAILIYAVLVVWNVLTLIIAP